MASESFNEDDIQQVLVEVARENGFEQPKFEVSSATKPGDNFVGRVSRAIVREDGKEPLSLIFKTSPLSKVRRDAFHSGILFDREGSMYNVVLPALNAFLREQGVSASDSYPCVPRCLRSKLSEDWKENGLDVLVFEDMSAKGYRTVERSAGLDAEQCRAILRQLALLHASSLALQELRPEEAQRLRSSLRERGDGEREATSRRVTSWIQKNLYLVEDRFRVGSPEYTKLKNYIDNYSETLNELSSEATVKCITHGDCWTNNFLFKYDKDDKLEDLCLIDFQVSKVTSPILDLAQLLYTCTTKATRDKHLSSLIRGYHEEVTSVLKALGCEPESVFSWSTFQSQLKMHGGHGLARALVAIPLFMTDASEMPDNLDTFMEKSDSRNFVEMFTAISNISRLDECKERVCDVLLHCIEQGYL